MSRHDMNVYIGKIQNKSKIIAHAVQKEKYLLALEHVERALELVYLLQRSIKEKL